MPTQPRRGRGRPREEASDARILEAAERVFARHGYGETSLRQLLAEAGLSTTSFYARYRSKEEVLDALVRQLLGQLYSVARDTVSRSRSLEEGFERGVEAMAEVLERHRVTARLALTEASSIETVRRTLHASYVTLSGFLASQLWRFVERRTLTVDPEGLAWAIVGALQMAVMRWAVFEELDEAGLRAALRQAARTLLPRAERRRTT